MTAVFSSSAVAYDGKPAPLAASEKSQQMEGIGITENLGGRLDLSLLVRREDGTEVPLGTFFDGKTPVILSQVYYSCPSLCNLHLNGLMEGLGGVDWTAGSKFQVLAFSFDPKETADVAGKKRESYLKVYDREGAEKGIHFLTATPESIAAITKATGFEYRWDDKSNEWAHASAAIVVTPDGTISRYLHGVLFEPQTIKLALGDATRGKIGTLVERLVWYCFQYDHSQSKYTLASFRLMQIGGALTILILGFVFVPFWLRNRRRPA